MEKIMPFYFKPRLLLGLCFFIMTNIASATDCYSESPALEEFGDDYFNLDLATPVSHQQEKALKALFSALKGKWQGSSTFTDCRGSDRAPKKVIKRYSVSTEFSPHSNGINFKTKRYDAQQKVTRQERVTLLEKWSLFSLSFGDDDNSLITASNKFRQGMDVQNKKIIKDQLTKQGLDLTNTTLVRSRLIEKRLEIGLNKKTLQLKISHFINGVFVAEEHFNLNR
jgi:hypothetical protein